MPISVATGTVPLFLRMNDCCLAHGGLPARTPSPARLLEKILEQDLEIRKQLIKRRDELVELMGTASRQKAMNRSYGAASHVVLDARDQFDKKGM